MLEVKGNFTIYVGFRRVKVTICARTRRGMIWRRRRIFVAASAVRLASIHFGPYGLGEGPTAGSTAQRYAMAIDAGASGIGKSAIPNRVTPVFRGEGTKGHFGYAVPINMAGIVHVHGNDVAFGALGCNGKPTCAQMLGVRSHSYVCGFRTTVERRRGSAIGAGPVTGVAALL